ncbi:MAG: S8 family serine peptidase [Rothia sp. (in: high G+C Gram-positive bacteria)]|uniref:S8 family serine peptidase n=1 Tax=Rothia sp. (in: high G+C Gram-positive bacteria) TaxID=1885016 RepID=UPI0026DFED27|nr:S8 family serine peptidase [Rothia sp. (in: high G+C Gram-positive bacteria)]MDO5750493.1 S8 family serine peptidase [Rothia sp. (in: high G+C Gram-positive bacteria)]
MSAKFNPKLLTKSCFSMALGATLAMGATVPLHATVTTPQYDDSGARTNTAEPREVLSDSMKTATGNIPVFVQFKGKGAYSQTQPQGVLQGKQEPVSAQAQVQAIQSQVQSQAQTAARDTGSEILYTTHNAMRGVALQGDAESIRNLAKRNDIERITPIVLKHRQNAGAALDTKTVQTWAQQQTGYTGKGVTIAVLDSGIDYTHADFGGPGTEEAYLKAQKSESLPDADSGLIDRTKLIGGLDLVGDDYDGSVAEKSTPKPDANPLDCKPEGHGAGGHGTHVAGTAAGYGVNADGTTFRGDYSKLTAEQVSQMKIGPGTAPEAKIVGIRVFGCYGTTGVVLQALDKVLDPNGDGDFSDRAQIINMSLGGEFAPKDDPESYLVDTLARQGILTVAAAGNANGYNGAGDTYSDSGSPANSASAISVANAYGSTSIVDRVKVLAPADKNGKEYGGDYSKSFDYTKATKEQLTGTVVAASKENRYGCQAFSAEDAAKIKDKWVYIDWHDEAGDYPCGSKVRFDNAQAAGAKGVVLSSNVNNPGVGIAGNTTIPGVRLSKDSYAELKGDIEAGTLKLELSADYLGSGRVPADVPFSLNTSSARGQHGSDGFIKPDVAAPGTEIISAAVGGGNRGVSLTGTSMASPHVAGIAALVAQAHPEYTPAQIKAAVMNGASTTTADADGHEYAVDRTGAGMVNAQKAVNTKVLAYNSARADYVSLALGTVEYTPDAGVQQVAREITLENNDSVAHTYTTSYKASTEIPGVSYSLPSTVTVPAHSKVQVAVTVSIDPAKLEKSQDPAMVKKQSSVDYNTGKTIIDEQVRQYIASASGRVLFSENGQEALRVPVHIAPKPVSAMKSESTIPFEGSKAKATVKLSGTELNQGGYKSLLGAFELGASSDQLPISSLYVASNSGADLQYVGAASDAPALKRAGKDPNTGNLYFGISTWGKRETLNPGIYFYVYIDTNNDGTYDYALHTSRAKGLDYPLTTVYKIDGEKYVQLKQYPINNVWGDIDTNLMDTNVFVMGVPLADLGLTAEKAGEISYMVQGDSYQSPGKDIDHTDRIVYKPFAPRIWFTGTESAAPGFFSDAPGELTVRRSSVDADAKALLLHMHNKSGEQAQVLTQAVKAPDAKVTPRFTDVSENDMFYKEISWLADRHITTGYADGTFRPLQNVERGAMAAFFYRMAGSPQFTAPSTPSFSDVPTSHPFYKEIEWMKAQGITTGYPDGTFRPQDSVNRDAMAAFFYRMAGSPAFDAAGAPQFSDVPKDAMFYKEISWLASRKITTGFPDGSFHPTEAIHRDAMAAFIYRYTFPDRIS